MRASEESRVQPLVVSSHQRNERVLRRCLGKFHRWAGLLNLTACPETREPGRITYIGAGHRQDGQEGRSSAHGVDGDL